MRKPPELKPISQILAITSHAEMVYEMYLHVLGKIRDDDIESLTEVERTVVCTLLLEAEVNNGGFDQYFFNSSGNWAKYTFVALTNIGASHTAALFRRALAVFPEMPSADRKIRWEQLDSLGDPAIFSQLDREFYEGRDDLSELLYTYIQKNLAAFGRAG